MKCANCGYFSFDYLSECKKCRANLADVRHSLGFSGAAPATLSLLGSLLKDYESPAHRESEAAVIAMLQPLDFEEALENAPWPAEPESEMPAPPPVIAKPEEAKEDFSLLDLSDDELDLLIDKTDFTTDDAEPPVQVRARTDDADFTLPESLSPAVPKAFKIEPAEAETPSEQSSGRLELVLEPNDYLPEFKDEPAATGSTSVLEQELPLDLPDLAEAPVISATEFEPDWPQDNKAENDFVIELSEDDLDSLLVELSHPPKDQAGAESEKTAKVEKPVPDIAASAPKRFNKERGI